MTTKQDELYASFATLVEMMRDRGEDAAVLRGYTSDDLTEMAIRKSVFAIDVPSARTRIIYHLAPKFKIVDIKKHVEESSDFDVYVLVTKEKLSTTAGKQLVELETVAKCSIDSFCVSELLFNISKHCLIPKHEPIRDDDAIQEIVTRYSLKGRQQLPLIFKTDPMARYLGLRPKELVKITRYSPAAGEYVMYRCCV